MSIQKDTTTTTEKEPLLRPGGAQVIIGVMFLIFGLSQIMPLDAALAIGGSVLWLTRGTARHFAYYVHKHQK